jgi:hypothetical protein
MADPGQDAKCNRAHAFVLPPRHRLFAIFDDPSAGGHAVEELRSEGYPRLDDIWVFAGEEGLRNLRLRGGSHRLRAMVVRTVQRAMTSDYRYLKVLEEAVRQGGMVVAVRVPNEPSADRVASGLRPLSAHSFAYGAHWDFVPVAA